MKKRLKLIAAVAAVAISVVTLALASRPSAALYSADDLYAKSLYSALYYCYTNSGLKSTIELNDFGDNRSLAPSTEQNAYVSTKIGNKDRNSLLKCSEVLDGFTSKYPGVITYDEAGLFKLGYEKQAATATVNNDSRQQFTINKIDMTYVENEGSETAREKTYPATSTGSIVCVADADGDKWKIDICTAPEYDSYFDGFIKTVGTSSVNNSRGEAIIQTAGHYLELYDPIGLFRPDIRDFPKVSDNAANDLKSFLETGTCPGGKPCATVMIYMVLLGMTEAYDSREWPVHNDWLQYAALFSHIKVDVTKDNVSEGGVADITASYQFKNNRASDAHQTAIRNFSGEPYATATTFSWTQKEMYSLYYSYLTIAQREGFVTSFNQDCGPDKPADKKYYFKNGLNEWCPIYLDEHRDDSYLGESFSMIEQPSNLVLTGKTFEDVLNWFIDDNNYTYMTSEDVYANGQTADTSTGPNDKKAGGKSKCWDLNAGGSLGWILCPILEGASKAVEWLYESAVAPFLETDASLFKMDGSNGTFVGWQIFQNFANIAAIIFLLIIIFSQVTGVGIDNYGIKKILPKLIIGVILINLSFIICQAAVDVSNLAGSGLKSMLDGLGDTTADLTLTIENQNVNESGIPATLTSGAIIGGLIVLLVEFPGILPAAAMAVLPALIGAVIAALVAILVLFVLLTVRKIAVVVLVVVAPMAFVCYMLPNTKKIFDKWLGFFKNMLLVFPICGLVIGGGNFVSKLILTSSGEISFMTALAGMLAGVIPFFFVPALLRGSMNVLGNIGTRLSGLGRNLGNRASGAINNTDRMKDTQKRLAMARNQRIYDRYHNMEQSGHTLSAYQRRRMNNARLAYNTAAREDISALAGGEMLTPTSDSFASARDAAVIEQEEKEIQSHMTRISTAAGFDAENGADLYAKAKAARAAGNHREADAYIELAGKNGKAASQFAEALRNDTGHVLSKESAKRIMNGGGSKLFKATDGIAFQYAREVYNGDAATKGQLRVDDWTSDAKNIYKAVEKNINNAEAFGSQSEAVLRFLNTGTVMVGGTPTNVMAALAAEDSARGNNYVQQLEQFAAASKEKSSDISKNAQYEVMRNGRDSSDMSFQKSQFESEHLINAELRHQRTGGPTLEAPSGYVTHTVPSTDPRFGHVLFKDPSGKNRNFDATKGEFF